MRTISALFVVFLAACGGVSGNGHEVTRTRDVQAFRRVSVASGIELQGATGARALTVTTDENLFEVLETVVDQDTLKLRLRPGVWLQGPARIKAFASNDVWEAIDASGGSEVRLAATPIDTLKVGVSGGSEVHVTDVSSQHLDVDASGGSVVELTGVGFDGKAAASGGSELHLRGVCLDALDVDVSGGSSVSARVATKLTGSASGGSTVAIMGTPSNQVSTSGASNVSVGER